MPKSFNIRGEGQSRRVWINEVELHPELSQRHRNHSPDGFNWGYGGSGPAQLALAIMLHCLPGIDIRGINYQDFKFKVLAGLTMDEDFELAISEDTLLEFVRLERLVDNG